MKLNFLNLLWTSLVTLSFVTSISNVERMHQNLLIVRQINFFVVLENIALIAVVATTVYYLFKLHPVFKISIFSLFNYKEEKETGIPSGTNINIMPYKIKYFGIVFVLLLIMNVPYFANLEEQYFREGITNWQVGLLWSFIFGMVHCLVGVPIAAGFGISISGMWFTFQYMKGGIEASTVHHTTYNLILCLLLLFTTVSISFVKKKVLN